MRANLRRISEPDLAEHLESPSKLYSDLFPWRTSGSNDDQIIASLHDLWNSPLAERIGERVRAGQPPLEEDRGAYQRKGQEILKGVGPAVGKYLLALREESPGISDDGRTLSLMNVWSALNFLFTGTAIQPGGSPVGGAIMGGTPIQWRPSPFGYVRYLSREQVAQVQAGLRDFPIHAKVEDYDPEKVGAAGVFWPLQSKETLLEYFGWLAKFYSIARENSETMLLWNN
jgi:hypothetical protein